MDVVRLAEVINIDTQRTVECVGRLAAAGLVLRPRDSDYRDDSFIILTAEGSEIAGPISEHA